MYLGLAMKYASLFFFSTILLLLSACDANQAVVTDATINVSKQDAHSFSNPNQARATHLNLDLTADFEAKTLKSPMKCWGERYK